MNWQVNRATPAVVITHKCQKAWQSMSRHIPRMSQPSLRDFARVQAFRPWTCSPCMMYEMIHRQNPSNSYVFDGRHFLVQIQGGPVCSLRDPRAASVEPTDHRFPSHGSSRCMLQQSQLKFSSFFGPNLDCVRYLHASKAITYMFFRVSNHGRGDCWVHQ